MRLRPLSGVGGCDDRSPVHPDMPTGLAGHVPDLGQAAVSALAHRRGAPAAADRPPAQPRHLRGQCLGQRHAVHDVGDPTRPPPPLPVLSASHELNVRTYVHVGGVPGVWFFSLDASNALAVLGARVGLGLPYFRARMRLQEEHSAIHFTSTRTHPGAPAARFEGTWARGEPLPSPLPDALEFFLIERYCLYTVHWRQLYRVRIDHRPWPLHRVERLSFTSTMLESQGLPTPREAPLVHAQGEPLRVGIWPPSGSDLLHHGHGTDAHDVRVHYAASHCHEGVHACCWCRTCRSRSG